MGPEYYRHSGKAPLGGLLAGLLAAGMAGIILGYAYGYIILYIPLAGVITFLITGGYGAGLGFVAAYVLKKMKVRNTAAALGVALLVTLVSWYFSWATWIYALMRRENVEADLFAILLQPRALWLIVQEVNKSGAWTISGGTPTGVLLWTFWALEAAIIFGVALAVAKKFIDAEPYCERCNKWCEEMPDVARIATGNRDEVKQHVEMKDFSFMEKAGAVEKTAAAWFAFDIHSCSECRQMNTLTVKTVKVTIDKKGKESKEVKEFVTKLLLAPHEADNVRGIGQKLTPKLDVGAGSAAPG